MTCVLAYLRERVTPAVFVPVVVLLAGAAAWSSADASLASTAVGAAVTLVLVVQFRLWDDIEDLPRDRTTHPTRVLVNAPAGPFRVALIALAIVALALAARQPAALGGLVVVNAGFWLAYRQLKPRLSPDAWCFGVLLLKYPAFIVITGLAVSGRVSARLTAAAAAAYVGASTYELWHDGRMRPGVSA